MRKENDTVEFALDGHWKGKGIIVNDSCNDIYEVELTAPCKEFPVGEIIIVDEAEIIS